MSRELKKEILGIGLLGVFLFLLVSLISYYPLGPTSQNLCGKAGFHLADILVLVFGMMSYLLAAFILLFALFYLKKKDPPNIIIFSSGLALFFISLSTLLQIIVGKIDMRSVSINFSGLLGFLLDRTLMNFFGYFGSVLICVILLLISLFLIIQAPIVSILEERLARKKTVERRKEIKVTTEEKRKRQKRKRNRSRNPSNFLKRSAPTSSRR